MPIVIPKKEELIKNSNKIYKFTNLLNDLFIYLNKNPLLKFKEFKIYAEKEVMKSVVGRVI